MHTADILCSSINDALKIDDNRATKWVRLWQLKDFNGLMYLSFPSLQRQVLFFLVFSFPEVFCIISKSSIPYVLFFFKIIFRFNSEVLWMDVKYILNYITKQTTEMH